MQSDTVVEARGVSKRYGKLEALIDASFTVRRGETCVILGPNGAGKTTLLEILEGIMQADSGAATLFGLPPGHLEAKRRIGVQLETGSFESELRVREIVELYSSFYPSSIPERELLESVGLSEKRDAFFGKLSKGMKQKAAIAVALVNDPELVFLDEVTSGLDVESRKVIWELIGRLKRDGKTVVLTTHDIQEAGTLGDSVMILSKGRIVVNESLGGLVSSFPVRSKVSYLGGPYGGPAALAALSIAKRQTVYTDDPERVAAAARESGGLEVEIAGVDLEDVYRFHIRGGTPE
ncbi:MAG: ABC transporter ATP-binding protein [Spirochaetales bacterium]|nr:ABC transporter ATP-binding protein [Spirochaetales bacterium]